MDLYDPYQAWESGGVRDTDSSDTRRIDDIRFTPDIVNVQHILGDLKLEKNEVSYQDEGRCLPSPVVVDIIHGTMESDVSLPKLHDVMVLVIDGIQAVVVTDHKNKCVKSFYTTHNHQYHSAFPLQCNSGDLAQLHENKVMISMPYPCQILTLEVNPDLRLLSTITTSKGYYSIAVLSLSALAAGGDGCVDLLDMAGHVRRSVTTHNNETLFDSPFYMCVNKGCILVSDWGKESATCMTSEGDVVWRYAPTGDTALTLPCDINTTSTGHILLAYLDANRVIQLTESGKFVRNVLTSQDGIPAPSGLYIDRHESGKFVGDVLTTQDGIRCPMGLYEDRHESLFVCILREIIEINLF